MYVSKCEWILQLSVYVRMHTITSEYVLLITCMHAVGECIRAHICNMSEGKWQPLPLSPTTPVLWSPSDKLGINSDLPLSYGSRRTKQQTNISKSTLYRHTLYS